MERDILRKSDEVLGTTPATDFNWPALPTIVNYARAKQESRGALARIREAISMETGKPTNQIDEGQIQALFVNLLQTRFHVNPQKANEFFQVLQQDAQ
jgi:hypothetical protein